MAAEKRYLLGEYRLPTNAYAKVYICLSRQGGELQRRYVLEHAGRTFETSRCPRLDRRVQRARKAITF